MALRERELDRLKAQAYASFVRGVERIGGFGGKSDILATSVTYSGTPHGYKERLQRLGEATTADLRDAAQAWLGDGVYALEVTPFAATKQVETPAERFRNAAARRSPRSENCRSFTKNAYRMAGVFW